MDEKRTAGQEMATRFDPQAIEREIYEAWESSGAFVAHREEGKKPFTIVMPPPNITGQLHMATPWTASSRTRRSAITG